MQHAAASASVTWEIELQRVAQWLSSKKRQREQQQSAILARVNTHVQFVHARKRDRELEAEAEEDDILDKDDEDANDSAPEADLALEFLDDVNADDIKSLLEAEAARSFGDAALVHASVNVLEAAVATTTAAPDPNMSMALIEMPSHLLAKNSPPKLYASPAKHVHLQPKFVVPPPLRLPGSLAAKASVSAHEGSSQEEDAGVAELMNELDLDISDVVHHLPHEAAHRIDYHEEHKTEESTPLHLRKDRSKANHQEGSIPSAMEALAQSVFSSPAKASKTNKYMKDRNVVRDGSDESDEERSVEHARSAQRPPVDPDAVGDEMHSWVSGYRNPDVIRRKELMSQRNRRPTARFGVNSVEEQRYINKAAKYYAEGKDVGSSDNESSAGSFGSDFSPDEVDDQDDPVSDVELLSDDYLDRQDFATTAPKAKPRRRLRNQHKDSKSAKKAKPRQKLKKTRAVKGANSATDHTAKRNVVRENSGTSVKENGAKKINSSIPPSQVKPSSNGSCETETIDLLSSDDGSDRKSGKGSRNDGEMRASDKTHERIPHGSSADSSPGQSRTSKEKEVMILRLNLSKSVRESATSARSATLEHSITRVAVNGVGASRQHAAPGAKSSDESGGSKSAAEDANTGIKTTKLKEGDGEQVLNASKAGVIDQVQSAEDSAADRDGDVSDAGTADLDDDMADQALDYEVVDEEDSPAADSAKISAVGADPPILSETATAVEKSSPAPTPQSTDKALQMVDASLSLSEALLAKHNLLEISRTKPNEGQEPDSANKDEESEAETIDFDDVEQLSNDEDFDFGGGKSSRQEDLGFSDDDNDDAPGVVAPHDEDYVQFFEDTPLRKLKVAQKQEQERKQSEASGVQSVQSKPSETAASTPASKTPSNTVNTQDSKPAAPMNAAKNKVLAVTAVVKEPIGSNGLRKATKPAGIATSTVLKGKFEHSRRSIKVIDDGVNNFERGKRSVSGVYAGNKPGVKKSRFSEPLVQYQENHSANWLTEEFISSISSPERRQTTDQWPSRSKNGNGASKSSRDEPDERYLSYGSKPNGTKSRSYNSDDEPLSTSARGPKSRSNDKDPRSAATKGVSSSQPEKSSSSSSWSFSSMVSSSNENVDSNPRAEKVPEFRRERQIDIYDALHIEHQGENGVTLRDLRDGEYKRPSAFKKVQEEKEKRGIAFVPREKFLENAPIPKKKKVPAAQQQKPPVDDQRSNGFNKRSNPAKPAARQKDNHYGPSSGGPGSQKNSSYDDRSSHDKYAPSKSSSSSSKKSKGTQQSKNAKFKSRRSPSPVSRRRSNESDSYRFSSSSRFKEDDRGRCRDHSRSRSPLKKHDRYGSGSDASSRKRYRSLSRSRSRDRDERSSRLRKDEDRDFRSRNDDRDRSHSFKDSRDSNSKHELSPPGADPGSSDPRKRARSLDRSNGRHSPLRNKEFEDPNPWDSKRAKPVDPRVGDTRKGNGLRRAEQNIVPPPPPDALFDSGSDMYISDSDGDQEDNSNVADIRFDLEEVPVDQRQMRRRVYVSGMNGMMDEEVLEELFASFGIEVRYKMFVACGLDVIKLTRLSDLIYVEGPRERLSVD